MPDFRAKMHQKSILAGPPPQLGELTALPRPPSWIWGPTSKGKGRGGERRGKEAKGGKGRGGEGREEKGMEGKEKEGEKRKGRTTAIPNFFRP